jgi:hypothetical protein
LPEDLMEALAASLLIALPLDDEIESHIDKGQPQVEPGDPDNEARELPYCACEPEAAT